MKANKLFLVILVISFVTSCKATKEIVKASTEAKTELNANVKTEAESKAAEETKTVATASTSSATDTNTKVIATEFSVPDINGKQHITRQTVTEQTTNNKKAANSKIDTESKAKVEVKAKTADKSKLKQSEVGSKQTVVKTETETPGFITVIALVVGLLGIALIFYLLKRFTSCSHWLIIYIVK